MQGWLAGRAGPGALPVRRPARALLCCTWHPRLLAETAGAERRSGDKFRERLRKPAAAWGAQKHGSRVCGGVTGW